MKYLRFFLIFFFSGCMGIEDISQEDVNRVKKNFLELRFQSTIKPEIANLKDIELFQLSCRSQRVNCKKVLKILQKEDHEFYQKLIQK